MHLLRVARSVCVITYVAMAKPQKFVEEILINGDLYHVLECGHFHAAVNLEPDMCPAEEQECQTCERAELGQLPN